MATIVIVGEETTNHRLVTLLGGHGHRVLEAADSEQALAIVRAEKPDLVLADTARKRARPGRGWFS